MCNVPKKWRFNVLDFKNVQNMKAHINKIF